MFLKDQRFGWILVLFTHPYFSDQQKSNLGLAGIGNISQLSTDSPVVGWEGHPALLTMIGFHKLGTPKNGLGDADSQTCWKNSADALGCFHLMNPQNKSLSSCFVRNTILV